MPPKPRVSMRFLAVLLSLSVVLTSSPLPARADVTAFCPRPETALSHQRLFASQALSLPVVAESSGQDLVPTQAGTRAALNRQARPKTFAPAPRRFVRVTHPLRAGGRSGFSLPKVVAGLLALSVTGVGLVTVIVGLSLNRNISKLVSTTDPAPVVMPSTLDLEAEGRELQTLHDAYGSALDARCRQLHKQVLALAARDGGRVSEAGGEQIATALRALAENDRNNGALADFRKLHGRMPVHPYGAAYEATARLFVANYNLALTRMPRNVRQAFVRVMPFEPRYGDPVRLLNKNPARVPPARNPALGMRPGFSAAWLTGTLAVLTLTGTLLVLGATGAVAASASTLSGALIHVAARTSAASPPYLWIALLIGNSVALVGYAPVVRREIKRMQAESRAVVPFTEAQGFSWNVNEITRLAPRLIGPDVEPANVGTAVRRLADSAGSIRPVRTFTRSLIGSVVIGSLLIALSAGIHPATPLIMIWSAIAMIHISLAVSLSNARHAWDARAGTSRFSRRTTFNWSGLPSETAVRSVAVHEASHGFHLMGLVQDGRIASTAQMLRVSELVRQGTKAPVLSEEWWRVAADGLVEDRLAVAEGYNAMRAALKTRRWDTWLALDGLARARPGDRIHLLMGENYSASFRLGGAAVAILEAYPPRSSDETGGRPWAFVRQLAAGRTVLEALGAIGLGPGAEPRHGPGQRPGIAALWLTGALTIIALAGGLIVFSPPGAAAATITSVTHHAALYRSLQPVGLGRGLRVVRPIRHVLSHPFLSAA